MVVGSLLPVGFLQLETAYLAGYDAARSLAFYNRWLVQAFFWLRFPGDMMLIAGAALFCYDVATKLRSLRPATPPEEAVRGHCRWRTTERSSTDHCRGEPSPGGGPRPPATEPEGNG